MHERDLDTDFLLIVVRDLLLRAAAVTTSEPGLRVIIMSATMDAELFSKYEQDKVESFSMPAMPRLPSPVYARLCFCRARVARNGGHGICWRLAHWEEVGEGHMCVTADDLLMAAQ